MLFFLSLVFILTTRVHGDLPVHCLRHQITGEWEFTLTRPKSKRGSCGHLRPDSEERQPSIDFINTLQPTKKRFILEDPDVVKDGEKVGTWTMVYDEGFEVAVPGFTYFAFSRFELVRDEYAENGHRNISHCDQTEVGWYHDAKRSQWGCYVGKKIGSSKKQDASFAETRHHHFSWESTDSDNEKTQKTQHHHRFPALMSPDVGTLLLDVDFSGYDEPLSAEWHQNVADRLNLIQTSWKAHAYTHLTNKTARSMNKDAGIRRNIPKPIKKPGKAKAFL
jgi:cathepsin C